MNFGHHPDPAVDFCLEVEAIENDITDRNAGLEPQIADLGSRIERAMQFKVGGDTGAVVAKNSLRTIEAAFKVGQSSCGVKTSADASAWWALVMGAAASIEDAANCLRDPDAKKQADGAAKHYRDAAQKLMAAYGVQGTLKPADPVPGSNYVQPVPDHCDRIVWRNRYYHLPIKPSDGVTTAPDGWKLVPVTPTPQMRDAAVQAICYGPEGGFTRIAGPDKAWKAMLDAAPAYGVPALRWCHECMLNVKGPCQYKECPVGVDLPRGGEQG